MGFALVLAGLLMIVTGARGTYAAFGAQIAKDFTGPPGQNFTYFLVGIGAVGALGYIDALRTVSRLFMVLVIISIFLANKGFFAQFTAALKQGPIAPQLPETGSAATPAAISSGAALSNQQGGLTVFGANPPATSGQAKANGWFNYLFGTGTNTPGP